MRKSTYLKTENLSPGSPKIDTTIVTCPGCSSIETVRVANGVDFEYQTCSNDFDFVICQACELMYLNPRPTIAALPAAYPASYKPFHFNKSSDGFDFILAVRNYLEGSKAKRFKNLLPKNARILDVGCGDGRFLGLLGNVSGGGWSLEGIDFNEQAVNRAREMGVKAITGSYEDTPLGESEYDLIIMNQVIEHFPNPAQAVEKSWQELKPGGLLSLETPSIDGMDARLFKRRFWGGYHFPRHLTLFSEASITKFLDERNFKVISVNYMLSPVFWIFSWHHWWKARIGTGSRFFSDSNPVVLGIATLIDIIQRLVFRKTSNMQVIARKV